MIANVRPRPKARPTVKRLPVAAALVTPAAAVMAPRASFVAASLNTATLEDGTPAATAAAAVSPAVRALYLAALAT